MREKNKRTKENAQRNYQTDAADAAGREPWIISIVNTEAENAVIQKVYGNIQEVKAYLTGLAAEDRENSEEEPDYGSDVQEEKYTSKSGQYVELCTYNCYSDYHIDYQAVPERALEVKDLSMLEKQQENEAEYEEERE